MADIERTQDNEGLFIAIKGERYLHPKNPREGKSTYPNFDDWLDEELSVEFLDREGVNFLWRYSGSYPRMTKAVKIKMKKRRLEGGNYYSIAYHSRRENEQTVNVARTMLEGGCLYSFYKLNRFQEEHKIYEQLDGMEWEDCSQEESTEWGFERIDPSEHILYICSTPEGIQDNFLLPNKHRIKEYKAALRQLKKAVPSQFRSPPPPAEKPSLETKKHSLFINRIRESYSGIGGIHVKEGNMYVNQCFFHDGVYPLLPNFEVDLKAPLVVEAFIGDGAKSLPRFPDFPKIKVSAAVKVNLNRGKSDGISHKSIAFSGVWHSDDISERWPNFFEQFPRWKQLENNEIIEVHLALQEGYTDWFYALEKKYKRLAPRISRKLKVYGQFCNRGLTSWSHASMESTLTTFGLIDTTEDCIYIYSKPDTLIKRFLEPNKHRIRNYNALRRKLEKS